MKNSVCQSETVYMEELNNLFIEMTQKSCNHHCKYCYIDFPLSKKVEDFIDIDTVKNALNDTMMENIKCIYLTGAEPMTHPDFNSILRLCLKRSNVCICTNGSFINEKKARFLKKVQDESNYELIFKISFAHYDEIKNDNVRYRGAFRQSIFALKQLLKYNFYPIVSLMNFYNENYDNLSNNFKELFLKMGIDIDQSHLQVMPYHDKNSPNGKSVLKIKDNIDCKNGRVLSAKGVYCCPFLASDYRGRCGSNFSNYAKKCSLETDYCLTCMNLNQPVFGIDYKKFA